MLLWRTLDGRGDRTYTSPCQSEYLVRILAGCEFPSRNRSPFVVVAWNMKLGGPGLGGSLSSTRALGQVVIEYGTHQCAHVRREDSYHRVKDHFCL